MADYIEFRLSAWMATSGDTDPSDPDQSFGGYLSTTVFGGVLVGTLFPTNNTESGADYRCLFVVNTHISKGLRYPWVGVIGQAANGSDLALCVDPTISHDPTSAWNRGSIPNASTGAQALTFGTGPWSAIEGATFTTAAVSLADEGGTADTLDVTVPSARTYFESNVPILRPGCCRAIWLRRTPTVVPLDADTATLVVGGWEVS